MLLGDILLRSFFVLILQLIFLFVSKMMKMSLLLIAILFLFIYSNLYNPHPFYIRSSANPTLTLGHYLMTLLMLTI